MSQRGPLTASAQGAKISSVHLATSVLQTVVPRLAPILAEAGMKPIVLFFHPRTFHEKNYRYFYIPYSLLSVASVIDRNRYDLAILDNNVERIDDWTERLQQMQVPLAVGISSMIGAQISDGLAFASAARTAFPAVPIVWGGALPTVLPELTVDHPLVDYAIAGQGQSAFPDLLDALTDGMKGQLTVPGVYGGGRVPAARRATFKPWEGYPAFRDCYDLVDVERYIQYDEHINDRTVNYHSSQGCPFGCGFCSEVALWERKWTGVTAGRILADIEHLIAHHGVTGIKFYDAEFFISRKRVFEFAQAVVDRDLGIRWAAAVHPRNFDRLSDDEVSLLARSGASRLLMGAESAVQAELDLVNKKTDREMLLRNAKRCADSGIVGSFSFVTGYPRSPSAHIEESLRFAADLLHAGPDHEAKVHFYAPYPGTALYDLAVECGFRAPATLEQWSEYDYYYITTPWIDDKWEPIVREFNEGAYPYLHADTESPQERLCPIIA